MPTEEVIKGYGVVVIKEGEVLLVKHTEKAGHITGVYGLPAGRAQDGESEIDTACRELLEETGLQVQPEDLLELPNVYVAKIKRSDGTVKTMSIKCYLAQKTSGEIHPAEDGETEPEWVVFEKLDSINLLPNVKNLVSDALSL